jgi:hypothetical protein
MSSENSLSFFGAGGHSHDGANSTLIDTRRYSLFDFSLGYKGSQTRINAQSTNQGAFEEYVIRIVNQQVLQPAGITLSPDTLDGQAIRANTITARELQANTITASEIASNTITATQLTSNIVLVDNIIRSNNFNGTFHANGVINSSGTVGWAISHAGSSVFSNTIVRGVLEAGVNSTIGGWTAGSDSLYKEIGENRINIFASNAANTAPSMEIFAGDSLSYNHARLLSHSVIFQNFENPNTYDGNFGATGITLSFEGILLDEEASGSISLTSSGLNVFLLGNTFTSVGGSGISAVGPIGSLGTVSGASGSFANGQPSGANNTGYWGGVPAFGFKAWQLISSYQFFNPSDGRYKDNKKRLPLGLSFINRLEPIEYTNIYPNWVKSIKDGEEAILIETTNGVRLHSGFEAQKVKQALTDEGVDDYSLWILADKNDPNSFQGLDYIQLIAPIVQAIQELDKKIDNIESRLQTLEDV